jgi:hypothetical protein
MPARERKAYIGDVETAPVPRATLQDLQASIAGQLQSSTATKMLQALELAVSEIIRLLEAHEMPASTLAYTAGVMTDKIGAILNGFASIQVEYSTQADDIAGRLADIARRVSSTGRADTGRADSTDGIVDGTDSIDGMDGTPDMCDPDHSSNRIQATFSGADMPDDEDVR